jgi:hypothetical protein
MLSFVVSTTGFMSYTHNCQHHESESSLLKDNQACCATDENTIINDNNSCCQTSVCKTDQDQTSCCSEEINYYRLSEWFTSPDSQKKQIVFKKVFYSPHINYIEQIKTAYFPTEFLFDYKPTIKIPIYRFLSQTKLDPHLI